MNINGGDPHGGVRHTHVLSSTPLYTLFSLPGNALHFLTHPSKFIMCDLPEASRGK